MDHILNNRSAFNHLVNYLNRKIIWLYDKELM